MGNRKIENVANLENGADAAISTIKRFQRKIIKDQILINLKLREDISRYTKIYQPPDNILTRVDDKGLLVKITLKVTKEDINVENRRITNVVNPRNGGNGVNLSTLLVCLKIFMQLY